MTLLRGDLAFCAAFKSYREKPALRVPNNLLVSYMFIIYILNIIRRYAVSIMGVNSKIYEYIKNYNGRCNSTLYKVIFLHSIPLI